jgi:hypothetical protein
MSVKHSESLPKFLNYYNFSVLTLNRNFVSCLFAVILLTGSQRIGLGQTAPPLGTAQKFAVLGASTVTNTGLTVLTGSLGVSPGSAITGFPPGVVTQGTIHSADPVAAQAQADALTAFNALGAEACTTNLTGADLGGKTLLPGVYCFNSTAQLTGTLTLNATSNPNGVFIFQIGSTFTTAANSAVVINGGSPCNVFYQVGSSATLGTATRLLGSIFARASITEQTGTSVTGGTYALNGAVTLDTNGVTACMGTLQVCKVAGSGVALGTPFQFNVAGTPVTVAAGASPLGACSVPLQVPSASAVITETIPAGTDLASVSTSPGAGLLISSNLAAGTATVSVTPGGQTTATFIDTIPPIIPTTGFLQICKVAGSGVTSGTPFTFNVGGTIVTVPAGPGPGGSCSVALVEPAGQTLIAESLPAGTLLTNVQTSPTTGLLVSSNLAAGQATVTVNAGAQTIVTFTDTVTPTTGTLQICKVAGPGVVLGTNFTFNVAGNPVTVPAGPAPGGSCSQPITVQPGPALISETLPAGTTLLTVSTSPNGLLVNSNLATGTATVTVTAGAQVIATFQNTIVPVVPTTGLLQICKVAGAGITAGTSFTFNVAGNLITVPAGPAPNGTCSQPIVTQPGPVTVTETLPSGVTLTALTTLPAGAVVTSNLATGTATVTVIAGGQTIVTFVDTIIPIVPTTGFLQICKVAGAGVALGTNFTFNVAGTVITVPAGAAPGGTCSQPMVEPAGPATIVETLPAGTTLTSVTTLPIGLVVSTNLAAGTATVTVNAGGQTIATFLDTTPPVIPTTGFLQICKVAGSGVAAGASFTFNIAGINTPITVPAGPAPGGSCSQPVVAPAGAAVITETLPAGTTLTAVSTLPDPSLLVSTNLAAGIATVTVTAGGQTIVTFLDTVIPVVPTTGTLQICKVAGTGVTVGTNFTFSVGGTPVTVPAGPAPGGSCSSPMTMQPGAATITETLQSGTTLLSVNSSPNGLILTTNLAAGTATVMINAGGQAVVTFVNQILPVIPTTGFIQVCKVAGAGVPVGTNFTFNVGGTPVTVPAGAAPGGTCSQPISAPAGPAAIQETLPAGIALTSVSTLPSGLVLSSNLAAGMVTVMVNAGGQTIATFLDTMIPVIPTTGFLQICKVAGAGVAVGTSFSFSVAGTPVTVQAGPAPGGTCSTPLVLPAGPATITETLPAGTTLTSVDTLPSGLVLSTNLAAGSATVMVNAGSQTIATFLDTVIPVIPTTGFLQICKVAGQGVPVGTNFTFTAAGMTVTVPAGPAPGGTCSSPLVVQAGSATIVETLPAGIALTAVTTLPSGLLLNTNLAAGTATVTVNAGGQTIATFLDTMIPVIPTTGFLQICKVAGAGVAVGTNFTFTVAGVPVIVPAGPAPGGTCSSPLVAPAGPATIFETLPAGIALTAVTTLPSGLLLNANLAAGTATVTVNAGGQTIATFLDTMIPVIPTTGFLQICKIAGADVPLGTNFTFNVVGNPTPIVVPAGPAPLGTCSSPIVAPAGPATIVETLPAGTTLTSVTTLPAGLVVSANLAAGTATVTVNAGGQTIATFLNTIIPVIPTTGFLQICKVAGAGINPGTNFTFTVGGIPVTVPAGAAPGGSCSPPIVMPAGPAIITETLQPGVTLTSVSTLPAGLLTASNLAAGTATVTVNAGGQTIATFLNTIVQTMGFLQICKVAGPGVTVGTNFTFNVAGNAVTVPAGPAPGGSCSQALQLPVGQAVVTEAPQSGVSLASVSVSPSGLSIASNLGAQSASVTIPAGGISTPVVLTFTNQAASGLLKICKLAGPGVTVGTLVNFTVGGTSLSVPAGYCSVVGLFPVGTQLTAVETIPSGNQVTSITVAPADRLNTAPNLATGTVGFTIGTGVTEVGFTNATATTAELGLLKVCKIAGAGVTVGANFSFSVAGSSFTVPAGYCVPYAMYPVGTPVTIKEVLSSTTVATAISALPANRQGVVDLAGQSIVAIIGSGVTEVYFTNVAR